MSDELKKQLGRAAVSLAQGAPEHVVAAGAVLIGGALKIVAAAMPLSSKRFAQMGDIRRAVGDVGTGFYAIAAVDEGGKLFSDVAKAIRGGSAQTAVAYDVVEGTAVSVSSGGGSAGSPSAVFRSQEPIQ